MCVSVCVSGGVLLCMDVGGNAGLAMVATGTGDRFCSSTLMKFAFTFKNKTMPIGGLLT